MEARRAWLLLQAKVLAHVLLFAGAPWCIAFPSRRLYPMSSPDGWYFAMRSVFGLVAWGMHTLGSKLTSGLREGLVVARFGGEAWLDHQHGDARVEYRRNVPRYL